MTKKKLREILEQRWDGISGCFLSLNEGAVVLYGTKHIHTTLYTPNRDTIRNMHNLRVRNLRKFEKWLGEICDELDIPWTTYEKAHNRKLEEY